MGQKGLPLYRSVSEDLWSGVEWAAEKLLRVEQASELRYRQLPLSISNPMKYGQGRLRCKPTRVVVEDFRMGENVGTTGSLGGKGYLRGTIKNNERISTLPPMQVHIHLPHRA